MILPRRPALLLPGLIILSLVFLFIANYALAACDLSGTSQTTIKLSLDPSAEERPLQPRAIVTIYTPVMDKTYDTGLADVLLLAHSFNNLPAADKKDVEFVVAFVGELAASAKQSFMNLGVRLLELPDLGASKKWTVSENAYKSCLYLFGLEAFSDILYVDAGVVFSKVFDSSVLLFKPSISRMNVMLDQVSRLDLKGYYLDQDFFNNYFDGSLSPSCMAWSHLPESLNLQLVDSRSQDAVSSSQIVPHNFWTHKPTIDSPVFTLYNRWKATVRSLFELQTREQKRSDVGLIPNSIQDLTTMLKANTFSHTFVILTIMTLDTEKKFFDRTMGNRERYCKRHPEVSHYLESKITAKNAVWQKVYATQKIINDYDWVWLLDGRDAMIMNGEVELRALIGMLILERPDLDTDIIIARDISEAMNAGSFFLRNSTWTRDVFIPEWFTFENHPDSETRDHKWQEQWAIIRLYEDDKIELPWHTQQLDQKRQYLFNSYTFGPQPTFKPGDFVLHSPEGGRGMDLYKFMKEHQLKEF
ncbi:hypothetical protein BCR33DRAFT_711572 [Rhizoclosmatium globosum]|uniref:Nucleotide-diphospho-sugar transferase n=1 Tax=Rhizoclosmatium globosum TaxID=329046 RepID=A0A1Y2D1V5_9FUNG|nr:hypothetical protein BCR33DRAFT_711572 [Rhizoclosmatium globosum]|eukprot:ORY53240.1 hypothetical protein BCR33DRAFT_711572 [Rhizoclosmatium globosum]